MPQPPADDWTREWTSYPGGPCSTRWSSGTRRALTALWLSEAEFRTHVWPSQPAARPERNLPFSYVWGDLAQTSEASLSGTLVAHGGRRYDLAAVRFAADPAEYGAFRVHRHSVFVVRDGSGTREIRVTGSMIEQNGRWKVFSHVVDD